MPTFKCYVRVESAEGSQTIVTATGVTQKAARSAALREAESVFNVGISTIKVILCIDVDSQNGDEPKTNNPRLIGVYLVVYGALVYYVGEDWLFPGTTISVSLLGILGVLVGGLFLLFPNAEWTRGRADRLSWSYEYILYFLVIAAFAVSKFLS